MLMKQWIWYWYWINVKKVLLQAQTWIYLNFLCGYLRNKFHFSEVYRSMNAMDHVQSKWRQKGVTLALHGTHCVHTLINLRKNKIHLLYLHCFSFLFVLLLVKFWFKFCKNKWRRKVTNRCVWLLCWTAVSKTWRQSNVTSANQLFHLSLTSLTCNVVWTSVVHWCLNLLGPK